MIAERISSVRELIDIGEQNPKILTIQRCLPSRRKAWEAAAADVLSWFQGNKTGWHCRKRYGWYHGHKWWHRHRRACYDNDYRPGIYGPGIGLNFYFSDDDDHHHHKKKKKGY